MRPARSSAVARAGRRRDERMGREILRSTDHRRLAAPTRLSRRRSSERAVCTSTTGTSLRPTATLLASIVDASSSTSSNNYRKAARRRVDRSSSTSQDPDGRGSSALERPPRCARGPLGLPPGTIKIYVLVEQLEATFQLMEIERRSGCHFVGIQHRAMGLHQQRRGRSPGTRDFNNPNIDAIDMTYGYMRDYEDRVRRAVNTPTATGDIALWQGGMEPNIPVGSENGVERGHETTRSRREREQQRRRERQVGRALEDGTHRTTGLGEEPGEDNQLGRPFPRAHATRAGRRRLSASSQRPGPIRGARDLISVAPSVRQRIRARATRQPRSNPRLLRQRRRTLPDGGHGHGEIR